MRRKRHDARSGLGTDERSYYTALNNLLQKSV
jgi:hypothetical protein